MADRRRGGDATKRADRQFREGVERLSVHPAFARLVSRARFLRHPEYSGCPEKGWAVVGETGTIEVHPTRLAPPEEWMYVLGHALLHLGLGHFRRDRVRDQTVWVAACDVVVARMLADFRIGRPPSEMAPTGQLPTTDVEQLYTAFVERGIPDHLRGLGTATEDFFDMRLESASARRRWSGRPSTTVDEWEQLFADGVAQAETEALEIAADAEPQRTARGVGAPLSEIERAHRWFIDHYPLLGALATSFRLIEDRTVCHGLGIGIAAVSAGTRELYANPVAGLTEAEWRFVLAHEFLHIALRHFDCEGDRHPVLWNFATDFAINDWLVEMDVGRPPKGVLIDPQFHGLSAESIYDTLVDWGKKSHQLASFRGPGVGDMLDGRSPAWWAIGDGIDLDALYRRAIAEGLAVHKRSGRGTLPAGLVEAIYALDHPPIPWDVELARWFEDHFSPRDTRRSSSRLSRRQSATPTIPRPHVGPREEAIASRTFGVVLDTSGSMDRRLLTLALGAIENYAVANDVHHIRVVHCDAAAYDQGYVAPEIFGQAVSVYGRGGPLLQPRIDLPRHARGA